MSSRLVERLAEEIAALCKGGVNSVHDLQRIAPLHLADYFSDASLASEVLHELRPVHAVPLVKARKLHGRMEFRGLQISIENKAGSSRHWYDPHAKRHGETVMRHPYGYIRGTEGTDGDHVDVFVGPHEDAPCVYVVTAMKAPDFTRVDENKCMLGFRNAVEARQAYLAHYDDPRFLGSIRSLPFAVFKHRVFSPEWRGRLIKHIQAGAANLLVTPIFNPSVFAASGAGRKIPQAIPDQRIWEVPKALLRKQKDREKEANRRRAFAKWARTASLLHGMPPERRLRYQQQFGKHYQERAAKLAQRTPQVISDPLTGEER